MLFLGDSCEVPHAQNPQPNTTSQRKGNSQLHSTLDPFPTLCSSLLKMAHIPSAIPFKSPLVSNSESSRLHCRTLSSLPLLLWHLLRCRKLDFRRCDISNSCFLALESRSRRLEWHVSLPASLLSRSITVDVARNLELLHVGADSILRLAPTTDLSPKIRIIQ